MSEQQTLDEAKKAVYSPYLNYSAVTTSSVYDYYMRAYKKRLPLPWKTKGNQIENRGKIKRRTDKESE